jgi:hypothetical protein
MPRLPVTSTLFAFFKYHHRHLFVDRSSYHICTYYRNAINYVINGKTSLIPTAPVLLLEPTFGRRARLLYHYRYVLLIVIVHSSVFLCWNAWASSSEPFRTNAPARPARPVHNSTLLGLYYHNAFYYVINGKPSLIPTTPIPLLEATFGWLGRVLYRDCYVLLNIVFLCWVASVSSEPFRTNAPAASYPVRLF